MKVILQDNRRYILRFNKGEEVLAGLLQFAKEQKIKAAAFTGIGACSETELGFYNPTIKEYRKKPYWEPMEVASLVGNLATLSGEPALHVHGVFARNDFTTLGGHVFKLVVSATCEIFLIKLDGEIKRALDSETNINLLQ